MLGSRGDAEDAVQEIWLRWHATASSDIRDTRAWLTTAHRRRGLAPAGRRPVYGAWQVARLLLGLFDRYRQETVWQHTEPGSVNGDHGLLFTVGLSDGGTRWIAMACAVAGGLPFVGYLRSRVCGLEKLRPP